jgi:hypothetical protein
VAGLLRGVSLPDDPLLALATPEGIDGYQAAVAEALEGGHRDNSSKLLGLLALCCLSTSLLLSVTL